MIQPVFNILSVEHSEYAVKAVLATNNNSQIFEGHFPGQPVVPGACMLQLVKEILSDQLQLKLQLLKAENIKFLGLVQPGGENLNLNINYQPAQSQVKISATLSAAETTCMKLQGVFQVIE